jgi:predicted metal-dependent enzyme (double-stranded beta helix superfamily)
MADVANRKLLENDKVIVWELLLEPGERTGVHRHEHDYIVHVIEGSTLRASDGNGTLTGDVELHPDDTYYFRIEGDIATSGDLQTSATHDAENIGPNRYREIMVEVK